MFRIVVEKEKVRWRTFKKILPHNYHLQLEKIHFKDKWFFLAHLFLPSRSRKMYFSTEILYILRIEFWLIENKSNKKIHIPYKNKKWSNFVTFRIQFDNKQFERNVCVHKKEANIGVLKKNKKLSKNSVAQPCSY